MDIVRPYKVSVSYYLEGGVPPGEEFDNPPAQLGLPEHLPPDYDDDELDMDMDEFKGRAMDECYLSSHPSVLNGSEMMGITTPGKSLKTQTSQKLETC